MEFFKESALKSQGRVSRPQGGREAYRGLDVGVEVHQGGGGMKSIPGIWKSGNKGMEGGLDKPEGLEGET